MAYVPFSEVTFTRHFIWLSKETRLDGSGQIGLDVRGEASCDDTNWTPDKHYNPMLPGLALDTILKSAASNEAKGAAIKDLIVEHRASPAEPVQGDTDQAMQARQNGNALSVHVDAGLDALLTALGVELPYTFTL